MKMNNTFQHTEWDNPLPGQTKLMLGDVVTRHTQGLFMVTRVGQSNVTITALTRQPHTVTDQITGESKSFLNTAREMDICPAVDAELVVERRGEAGCKEFLATKKRRSLSALEQTSAIQNESDEDMKSKVKGAAHARGGLAAAVAKRGSGKNKSTATGENGATAIPEGMHSTGELGSVFGLSVCAVIRAAGKAEISSAAVKGFLKKKKVKFADATVSIQLGKGRNGKMAVPDLTKEQLDEIRSFEPAPEPKKDEKKEEAKAA